MAIEIRPGDALLLVDVQIDFCPGGALPVPSGDVVVPALNDYIAAAVRVGAPVYASRDWHPLGHPSFIEEGGAWPPHCIQDTPGAAFHPALSLPRDVVVVTKGTRFDKDQYSVFDETGFTARLERDHVTRLLLGGLALDICVRATALDARNAGIDVQLVPGGSLPVSADAGRTTIAELRAAGVELLEEVLS